MLNVGDKQETQAEPHFHFLISGRYCMGARMLKKEYFARPIFAHKIPVLKVFILVEHAKTQTAATLRVNTSKRGQWSRARGVQQ